MSEERDELGDLGLEHEMIGEFHVYTSRLQPALCVASRSDSEARALIRPQLQAIREELRKREEPDRPLMGL